MDDLVHAWNFVKQAAENSQGNLQYHQVLQDAIAKIATVLQEAVDKTTGDETAT